MIFNCDLDLEDSKPIFLKDNLAHNDASPYTHKFGSKRLVIQLVSWCFEPSQPQRIVSGLNTNFTLSPSDTFHVIIPQVMFFFYPIYILRALNMGICIQQGDLFYSVDLHMNWCQPQPTQDKIGKGLGKMQVNGLKG